MADNEIYYSPFPDVELPETSIWHFIFGNPNPPADDKVVYVDCLTDRQIKLVVFSLCSLGYLAPFKVR